MKMAFFLIAAAFLLPPKSSMAQVPIQTLRPCLDIEDQSKERLNCYDERIAPTPKKTATAAKTVGDCRFLKEEDERLNCFNRFVNNASQPNTSKKTKR
jgi:hypothetical protein